MLELRNITAGYDAGTVLRDVSITVPDGAVVALLGPNGAGKTTLLKVASGLLGTRAGQILVDGEDVTNMPPYQLVRRGICHVPEGRGIFPSLSVTDNIRLQAPPPGTSRSRCATRPRCSPASASGRSRSPAR